MWPMVQRHTMLVEYAEHGTSACETADSEDVINAVPLVVHVHDILLTLQFRQCPFRLLCGRIFCCRWMMCADALRSTAHSSDSDPNIRMTCEGLVSGNSSSNVSMRSWMEMMRTTFTRQYSMSVASSRLPRRALYDFKQSCPSSNTVCFEGRGNSQTDGFLRPAHICHNKIGCEWIETHSMHSTEAKNDFKSMAMYVRLSIALPLL